MKPGDKLRVAALCSVVLGLLTILFGHAIPEKVYAPAAAGVVAGLFLTPLVIKYGGSFSDIAVIGVVAALIGALTSTLTYFVIVGLQWQAMGYWTVIEYLTMMLKSGLFIVRLVTDFVMGLATLLTSAGLVAVLVIGE